MPAHNTGDQFPEDFDKYIDRSVKYVLATHGQHYSINFKKDREFNGNCDHLAIRIVIDNLFSTLLHEPEKRNRRDFGQDWAKKIEFVHSTDGNGLYWKHTFKFCDIVPVENDEATEGDSENKTMGVIRLYLYRMHHSGVTERKGNGYGRALPNSVNQDVPGKDMVKDSHVTTRSAYDTHQCEKPEGVDLMLEDAYKDDGERPFFVFELRYMNKNGLVAADILDPYDPKNGYSEEEGRKNLRNFAKWQTEQKNLLPKARRAVKREQSQDPGPGPSPKKYKFTETVRDDGRTEIVFDSSDDEVDDGDKSDAESDGLFVR